MKRSWLIVVLAVLVILTTAFIFFNSTQNKTQSDAASDSVISIIRPVLDAVERLLGEVNWDLIIRKGAHLTEFCLLGIWTFGLAYAVKRRLGKTLFGYGFFYVLAAAVTDEYIQTLSDRFGAVTDVLIDFCGAMIGFGLVWLTVGIYRCRVRSKTKRKKRGA